MEQEESAVSDKIREAFERQYEVFNVCLEDAFTKDVHGAYIYYPVSTAWNAWQAAHERFAMDADLLEITIRTIDEIPWDGFSNKEAIAMQDLTAELRAYREKVTK